MISDESIIADARRLLKVSIKDFSGIYSEMCGGECSEAIKSALDGQLRIAENLDTLENMYCVRKKEPIADNIELNRFIYANHSGQ